MNIKPKIKLVDNWRAKLKHAWSVRILAISGVMGVVFQAWPTWPLDIFNTLPDFITAWMHPIVIKLMPAALTGLAIWVSVIRQEKLNAGK
ncbi:hypothetical protein KFK14_12975 [Sphingobium phenoxybenzoativorans]|uniref:Uncharacterized protein n=1 Tax=Sphingobium phenoxybenzoativorans TaxID=1592790 RepID=A0A975PZL4_9SPHN|nr:hypothetical protein [Sphingobium phenoxybenzoativorans]QUT04060.1 hypothetical protein KFK14_12975 [Sphingobium phenoxybenzoativorans]